MIKISFSTHATRCHCCAVNELEYWKNNQMANSKPRESPSDPLLPPPQHPQPYILLPVYPHRRRRYCTVTLLLSLLILTLVAAAVFVLWPSDPALRVVRLRLDHLHVSAKPPVSIDVSLAVKLRIRNPDFFAVDYRSLDVAIGYRGRQLGRASSEGGRVRARTVSYVDSELRLDGIQVLHDVFYLIEDVLKGSIPFDTVTEIKGVLHFLVFDIPIKGKIACGVHVNPANKTIIRQDCYPE